MPNFQSCIYRAIDRIDPKKINAPLRMKGKTVAGRLVPAVNPPTATAPPYLIWLNGTDSLLVPTRRRDLPPRSTSVCPEPEACHHIHLRAIQWSTHRLPSNIHVPIPFSCTSLQRIAKFGKDPRQRKLPTPPVAPVTRTPLAQV